MNTTVSGACGVQAVRRPFSIRRLVPVWFAVIVFLCPEVAGAQNTQAPANLPTAATPNPAAQNAAPLAAPALPVWNHVLSTRNRRSPFEFQPQAPRSIEPDQPSRASGQRQLKSFPGSDQFVGFRPSSGHTAAKGDISLDFADADIHDVVRSVLGDTLGLPYSIDPQVTGRITLKTAEGLAKSDVLITLEQALKLSGFAIVQSNGIYNVVPISEAEKPNGSITLGSDRMTQPGYGTEIVPLRYVSAEDLQRVLTPLVPTGGIVSVDAERNLIFISGTEPERASMRQTIDLFDVDYLKSMSFSIIQPTHVDAETLATELDKIFEGTENPVSGLVRLIPISRINSLLVVSSRAAYLQEVNDWVSRLDVPPVEPGRRLYYYRLQNARAADVAQTLAQLFGGSAPVPTAQTGVARSITPAQSLPGTSGTVTSASAGMLTNASMPATPAPAAPPPAARFLAAPNDGIGPQIVTDEPNNALIIRANQADYTAIERMLHEMDRAPDQVLIEATIAEVTLNKSLQYGLEWYFSKASQNFTFSQTGTVAPSFPGFAYSYLVPNVQVAVSALSTLSHVTVLSSPKVLTVDNKPASLEVGDEVPIVSQSAVSVNDPGAPLVSTVEMQDTGVILNITPRISKSGMVFLDVDQEVSDVISTTSSQIDSPTIEQRKIQATVGIQDGQTVALGGLIQKTKTKSDSGIPFLKDIPYIGSLVKNVDDSDSRSELVVFLTPHIIRDPSAARVVTTDLMKGLGDVKQALDESREEDKTPSDQPTWP